MVGEEWICNACHPISTTAPNVLPFFKPSKEDAHNIMQQAKTNTKPAYMFQAKCPCGNEYLAPADPHWGVRLNGLLQFHCKDCNNVLNIVMYHGALQKPGEPA